MGVAIVALLAFATVPAAAQASAVNLETVGPFVVLGGSTVTNTGPSVLNGDLGLAPGTSLTGFGLPAVVNGATHNNDAVAGQAQADLTNAYNVAAGQPVAPADDLTGEDLGGMTLTAGAYGFSSSAQLTGQLTLDAQGDPQAQFVFLIGSTLTTASASSVLLVNGASPCNVYWQVGSSATLGSTTAFAGNLMALTDISVQNGAMVVGRLLARNGQISLINNVLSHPGCATGSTTPPPPGTTPADSGSIGTPAGAGVGSSAPSGGSATNKSPTLKAKAKAKSKGKGKKAPTHNGTAVLRPAGPSGGPCTDGFLAAVRGRMIERVVFSLDGRRIGVRKSSPFEARVEATPGAHSIRARVLFEDATRTKTMTFRYRGCAEAVLRPQSGPSQFTG